MTMAIDGQSNFARAVGEARKYIESAPRGYAFSLLVGGSVPNALVPAPVADRKHLLQVLEEATPVQGTLQVPDTLAAAAKMRAAGFRQRDLMWVGNVLLNCGVMAGSPVA